MSLFVFQLAARVAGGQSRRRHFEPGDMAAIDAADAGIDLDHAPVIAGPDRTVGRRVPDDQMTRCKTTP